MTSPLPSGPLPPSDAQSGTLLQPRCRASRPRLPAELPRGGGGRGSGPALRGAGGAATPRDTASARPRRPPPRPLSAPGGRMGTAWRAAPPRSGCFGTSGQRPRGAASIHPSVRPSLRGWRLVCVCVCVTDTAARTARGQQRSRPQRTGLEGGGDAGAPRLWQPRLRSPEPSPMGATSAASLLLLLPPGG